MAARILIVDDKRSILEILETALRGEGFETVCTENGRDALAAVAQEPFDVILCDVRLPDVNGTEILRAVREKHPQSTVIMITAYGSIENAIECMKLGADDYITKPFNLEEIKAVIRKGVEKANLVRENIRLREELGQRYGFGNIIGKSKPMQNVFDLVRRVAASPANVLVAGETGTGKELVSRAIHINSARADGPFVALNCAAIPENLLESELFGHVRGSFTGAIATKRGMFEEADHGTLLLDEVSELHPGLQAKLLRALDENSIRRVGDTKQIPVDVRLICSTNADLREAVRLNRFRLDLYHRIRVVEISIPPLRERREDIPLLSTYYLEKISIEHNRPTCRVSTGAMSRLLAHSWPGNVRELINVLEQAVLLCEMDLIAEEHLTAILAEHVPAETQSKEILPLKDSLMRSEKDAILSALRACDGSRKDAARLLNISERSLYYKLEEHHIS